MLIIFSSIRDQFSLFLKELNTFDRARHWFGGNLTHTVANSVLVCQWGGGGGGGVGRACENSQQHVCD